MIGSLSSSPSCNFVDENKIRPEFKDLDAFLNRYNALPNLTPTSHKPVVKCKTVYCRLTVGFRPFLDLCMWTFL